MSEADEDDRAPRKKEPPVEADARFPSGPWMGFWIQRPVMGKQWMQALWLRFSEGRVSGGGSDVVGRFTFSGRYDLKTGSCHLLKQYVGAHLVEYDGRNDNDGLWIWGVWKMRSGERGGFHVWPRGVEDPTQRRLKAEKPVEVAEPVGAGMGD